MFGDINQVELLGNITSDPELKYTTNGTAVLNVGIATNRRVKKGEEWVDETDFHNIVFWSNLATGLGSRIRKGTRIFVRGQLRTRTWDGDDGKKNYRTEIHVINMQDCVLIARYEGAKDGGAGESAPKSAASASANNAVPQIDPDDLPF